MKEEFVVMMGSSILREENIGEGSKVVMLTGFNCCFKKPKIVLFSTREKAKIECKNWVNLAKSNGKRLHVEKHI